MLFDLKMSFQMDKCKLTQILVTIVLKLTLNFYFLYFLSNFSPNPLVLYGYYMFPWPLDFKHWVSILIAQNKQLNT